MSEAAATSSKSKELELKNMENAVVEEKKEHGEREQWSSGLDFFLSSLGYAVGVGNVWRFPYLAYRNGGGVFLIPYFLFMAIIGIPMVYLEFTVGQFTSKGPLQSWTMIRISRGVGISVNIANSLLILFYNMVIAYSLYFLVLSLTSELPWQYCRPEWSSPNCVDNFDPSVFTYTPCNDAVNLFKCETKDSVNFGRCFNKSITEGSACEDFDVTTSIGYWKTTFPSQDYWNKVVLQKSSGIDESGDIVWQLVVALFCSYTIVYLMMVGGKKISGKLVWFTSLFPYVVLLILGIRGWMLPGAGNGIKYYIIPDWSKLYTIQIWSDAATQIFFTLSIAYGGMSTLSSYNQFNHNILRDSICIPVANCLTSFFAGFVIFSYIGYLSHITGQDIENIIQAGQGLAYVVYPYAVTTIPVAPLWAIMFFFMFILLGIDSALGSLEVTIAGLMDQFPQLESTKLRKFGSYAIVFSIYFIGGLIFTLQSGTYWIEFFNNNAGGWAILIVGFVELVTVSWLYGMENIRKDITVMIGSKYTNWTFYIWYALWGAITPGILIVIVIISFTQVSLITIADYTFPYWTLVLGQMMTASLMLGVVLWPIYAVIDAKYYNKRSIKSLFQPDFEAFVPMKKNNKLEVDIARGFIQVDSKYTKDNLTFESGERF